MRLGPGGHHASPGSHHEGTRAERGVHEVLAEAAEQHLDDDDGEQRAEHDHPPGSRNRYVERDQRARDKAGQVADGVRVFYDFVINGFEHGARDHGNHGQDERARAEGVYRNAERREQCDQHIQHQAAGIVSRLDMG